MQKCKAFNNEEKIVVQSLYNFGFGIPSFENEALYLKQSCWTYDKRAGLAKMNLFVVQPFAREGNLGSMQDTLSMVPNL